MSRTVRHKKCPKKWGCSPRDKSCRVFRKKIRGYNAKEQRGMERKERERYGRDEEEV